MSTLKKLLGWLFSNLLLIVIVVVASYAFVYWDDPFGRDTPLGRVVALFSPDAETITSLPTGLSPQSIDDGFFDEELADVAAADEVAEDESVAIESSIPVGTSLEMGLMPVAPAMQTEDAARLGDVEQQIEEELDRIIKQSASNTQLESEAERARKLLIDARESFHRGDHANSIAAYENLSALQADNFDVLGELGNVYFTRGEMPQAADAWFRSAMIMVSQGQIERAASLLGFLGTVDREKAQRLADHIQTVGGAPEPYAPGTHRQFMSQ